MLFVLYNYAVFFFTVYNYAVCALQLCCLCFVYTAQTTMQPAECRLAKAYLLKLYIYTVNHCIYTVTCYI